MNLKQYQNCWAIPQQDHISISEFYREALLQKETPSEPKDKEILKKLKVNSQMLEYILCICEELKLNCLTKNNTLLLINKYIK